MAFQEVKERQRAMWGSAPYERITQTLRDIHEALVETLSPEPGERWLDLACGTGAVAELAAERGASVTGVDLSPELLETARRNASAKGLAIDYVVGDCERLDVDDASFDVVSSCVGIMFAPDHEATAAELARVVRPGGRLALANWTPEGGVGVMFRMMAPFQPAPPPANPFDWGKPERVQELLGDAFAIVTERRVSVHREPTAEDHWRVFAENYGPTKTLVDALGDRSEELHQAWLELFESQYCRGDAIEQDREWLLVHGVRR